MRIAIASESDEGLEGKVAEHFGRCPYYTIVQVEGGAIESVEVVANPFYGRHIPGEAPAFIRDQGADVIIAGGMGRRAIALFQRYGIRPVTGATGRVRDVLEDFLKGKLSEARPCPGGEADEEV